MFSNVIFDFDGVMVDSNEIRNEGFRALYASGPSEDLEIFMEYVQSNHGLSRYSKIKYYYEQVKRQVASDTIVQQDAEHYSQLVAEAVTNAQEISGAEAFLRAFTGKLRLALISASDQRELREICRRRKIDGYFDAILGSPEKKSNNIINLLRDRSWSPAATVYVGDSPNDFDAASSAGIAFIGFGKDNFALSGHDPVTIESFEQLPPILLGAD